MDYRARYVAMMVNYRELEDENARLRGMVGEIRHIVGADLRGELYSDGDEDEFSRLVHETVREWDEAL